MWKGLWVSPGGCWEASCPDRPPGGARSPTRAPAHLPLAPPIEGGPPTHHLPRENRVHLARHRLLPHPLLLWVQAASPGLDPGAWPLGLAGQAEGELPPEGPVGFWKDHLGFGGNGWPPGSVWMALPEATCGLRPGSLSGPGPCGRSPWERPGAWEVSPGHGSCLAFFPRAGPASHCGSGPL